MSSPDHPAVASPPRVARVYGRAAVASKPAEPPARAKSRGEGSGSDSDGSAPTFAVPKFGQWKAQLAALDKEFDSDDDEAAVPRVPAPLRALSPVRSQAMSKPSAGRQHNADHASSPSSSQRGGTSFDFSMDQTMANGTTPDTSPSTSPIELLAGLADKPSRPPASRRQSAQSSHDELDEKPLPPTSRGTSAVPPRKKKAKADPSTNKPAKPKRLTKKEEAEMKRETARMLSDQRVSLSRGARDTRLSLSDLTAKLSSKCQPRKGASGNAGQVGPQAPSSPIDMFSSSSAIDELAAAAAPSFVAGPRRPMVKPKDLNALLLKRGRAQAASVRKEKEEDWVRRGGVLKRLDEEEVKKEDAAMLPVDAEEEEARDPDWEPDAAQGDTHVDSASSEDEDDAEPGLSSGDEDAEDDMAVKNQVPPTLAQRSTDDLGGDTEDEDDNIPLPPKPTAKRRVAGVIADSDSENEAIAPRERILVAGSSFMIPHRPASSLSASESEKDKENSKIRAFDDGENTENPVAPMSLDSPSAPRRSRSLLSDDENENKENAPRALPTQRPPLSTISRLERRYTYDGSQPRAVLGVLATDDRPTLAELSLDSPQRPGDGSPLQMKRPIARPFDDDDLGGGFTQLFEQDDAPRGRPTLPRSLSASIPRRLFDGFGPTESQKSLQFTPTQNRRPVMQISETQRMRDDEIMVMEMEDMPTQAPSDKEPEWFINDKGLMTQTRPSFTPIAPTPVPALGAPFGSSLAPSPFDRDMATPASEHVLRRLKRKSSPQPLWQKDDNDVDFFSPTGKRPEKRQRNAFDLLNEGAKKDKAKSAKLKKQPSEFVQDQADESDDETGLGFGGVKEDDEVVDEEAMKAAVEGMMDDQQMDVDAIAEELILEKHKEHLQEDDLKLQELHEKATRGDLRKKKRSGGLNLDDDSSDEEGFKRPRPSKHARNIENDSLPDLAKNPRTKAFFDVYQDATVDADMIVLPEMDLGGSDEEEEAKPDAGGEASAEEDEDAEPATRMITARDLRRELLAAAKKPAAAINPEDIDWLNDEYEDDDEMQLQVEEVPRKPVAGQKSRAIGGPIDRDLVLKRSTAVASDKLQSWAKQEGSNKSLGARRGGALSSVTGHGAPSRTASSSNPTVERRKLKAASQAKRTVSGLGKFLEKKRQS
ncbi:hypothetical protein EXIGLDRAFT_715901 [Exidia glandulosa HHB12029]|uniref:DNA replication checkpoint mediator MRC1 domain-containing protein n=1 Tax=Exidia glandulosa HHB12029 TaxID=1314781 RepID=A0A165QND7_EXIGL|nr:hypothetical protein EXIGLDRAFT_715901 [Exidia glandulosa HHB12029]